ncbi:toMV resistance protein Tm-2(2)-like [Salvia splendens]|uniref:toMV resistance protein Tm-2(2)-like n=1 Tax=Salvia splendens TaxID=180675 RepID=UPI001C2712BB|nr:toMV resistance protein Tm-2(2)-like [Salvia splendens]
MADFPAEFLLTTRNCDVLGGIPLNAAELRRPRGNSVSVAGMHNGVSDGIPARRWNPNGHHWMLLAVLTNDMAYEALESLQQTLLRILHHLTTRRVKERVISIHDKAVVLQLNLNHFPEKETIREVANATLEIIQYIFSPQKLSIDPTLKLLGKLAEEIDSTGGHVVDYCKSNSNSVEDLKVATELIVRISNRLRRLAVKIKSTPIELVDEDSASKYLHPQAKMWYMQQIMDRLVRDDILEIQVIPIVGMGGIVSRYSSLDTFLLKLLASLKRKLDLVGRYSLEEMELEMNRVISERMHLMKMDGIWSALHRGLLEEIYKILWGRRYLIVMDNIWSLMEDRNRACWLFPDNHNGSRIMLTTRLMNVAALNGPVHMMRFLDDEQSWHLFQHKVFGDQGCPLELHTVGEKIVKGCGGLPLSIVTVARLLSMIPTTPKLWQQIEANAEQLGSVLSLSYNHLSLNLRKCFLYIWQASLRVMRSVPLNSSNFG